MPKRVVVCYYKHACAVHNRAAAHNCRATHEHRWCATAMCLSCFPTCAGKVMHSAEDAVCHLQPSATALYTQLPENVFVDTLLCCEWCCMTDILRATPGPPALRGNILAAGGINGGTAVANLAEVYNPTMGTWSATGSLTAARYNFQMVLLNNFNVLAAGGQTPARPQLVDAEVYSPSTGTWTATGSLSAGRHDFQMVLLRNGNVLAAGGFGNGIFLDSAEVYSPTNGTWSATGSFPGGGANAREFFGMVLLPSGNVLAAGGSNQGGIVASALVYSPTMGTWTATGSLATARYGFQMLLLPNGNVLAAGGANNGGSAGLLASAELYNATTGTWSPTGSLLSGRLNFQMVLLSNGNVLAAGGETIGGAAALASAEVYSPTTGTWTPTGSLASARYSFQMALLPNGNVLAASGYNGSDYLTSAEVYSPMTSTWTATGSLANPRSFFQMAGF